MRFVPVFNSLDATVREEFANYISKKIRLGGGELNDNTFILWMYAYLADVHGIYLAHYSDAITVLIDDPKPQPPSIKPVITGDYIEALWELLPDIINYINIPF
jgi:hypothetical protein